MGAEVTVTWGTWEELLLGGAVLRHGTRDWTVVAAELRARTLSPYAITPEIYHFCRAWFEELKKKRVEELKRALEQSEDSIGSLESKLESLKAGKNEKGDDCHVDNDSVGPELQVPPQKLERVESSTKEMSKDRLSAGSFTHQTQTKCSQECQVPTMSSEDLEIKPGVSGSIEQEKVPNVDMLTHTIYEEQGGGLKKQRGKRKRKDCGRNINEASAKESNFSADVSRCKESSTSNCGEVVKSSGINDENNMNLQKDGIKEMMEILDSVLEIKGASAFYCRHDSQKRGRYKKIIRRHMDFDTIRTRIKNQAIKSVMELFRDLLLLANNALVFYSKNTREYKSAILLRTHVTKKLRENVKCCSKSVTHANVSTASPVHDPSVNVRSVRPSKREIVLAVAACDSYFASGVSHVAKKPCSKEDSPPAVESLPIKKAFCRRKRLGRETAGQRPATPMKERKRGRTK